MASLSGKKIAVLVTSGVEEVELTKPVDFLRDKGAEVTIIVPTLEDLEGGIKTLNHLESGQTQSADALLENVDPNEFDALLIPGGFSPDHLRLERGTTEFVRAFADKPIFAICHAPQILISADMVKGRTLTSWPAIAIDLKNAGANWVDKEVVTDGNLLTSRMPKDIPAFNRTIEQYLINPEQMHRAA